MYFKRLRNLREDKELTQSNIAELLNMKQQQYARYENGINEIPFEYIIKLAKFYNVSIDYIAELTDSPNPYKRKWEEVWIQKKEEQVVFNMRKKVYGITNMR